MKIRYGFVSNSSSSSFMIKNKSDKKLTLKDFAIENIHLLHEFNKEYDYKYTEEEFLKSVADKNKTFKPHTEELCTFGDEDGTIVGHVYDYILRYNGESENWEWRVEEVRGWSKWEIPHTFFGSIDE